MPVNPDPEASYAGSAPAWEGQSGLPIPPRPHRRLWTPATGLLLALLIGAGGFLAGVELEKGQFPSSVNGSSDGSLPSALRGRLASGGGAGGAGAAGIRGGAAGAGFAGGGSAGGFAGRGLFGGGSGSFGTVSSVSGDSIYLTDISGNTIKVTLTSHTALSKSEPVSRHAIRPGDTIVVQGLKAPSGTITATSVSDSGNRSAGASSGPGAGSAAGSSSAGAAISSLFGGSG